MDFAQFMSGLEKLGIQNDFVQADKSKKYLNITHDTEEFLLRSHNDTDVLLTVARWKSIEDWQLFWENTDHSEMNEMHIYAERLSEEVFHEISDHTI